jgi:hypothetical protein
LKNAFRFKKKKSFALEARQNLLSAVLAFRLLLKCKSRELALISRQNPRNKIAGKKRGVSGGPKIRIAKTKFATLAVQAPTSKSAQVGIRMHEAHNGTYFDGPVKKHALSDKARTTVLYATSPRSFQVEVQNSLTIRVVVQGRMTRGFYSDSVSEAVNEPTGELRIGRKMIPRNGNTC